MNPLDNLFEDGSQPIRHDAKFLHRRDENGESKFKVMGFDGVTYSPSNSLDHAVVEEVLHCGHTASAEVGGACCEPGCFNVSCKACYANSRCSRCFKGLCLEHRNEIQCNGVIRVVCGRCQEEIQRQGRNRAVLNFLISPFIDFKDHKS